jgi:AraC family transcriptional activator of pobA
MNNSREYAVTIYEMQHIPILKSNKYRLTYFKDEIPVRGSEFSAVQHIEVHDRRMCKSAIDTHRLDFYLVSLATKGEGMHIFGTKQYDIKENTLCFIGPGVISSWQAQAVTHEGIFCTFSEDFFNLGRINKQFLQEIPFFHPDGKAVLELTKEMATDCLALFTMMHNEYSSRNIYSHEILRSFLHVLLNKVYAWHRDQGFDHRAGNHAGTRLVRNFTEMYRRDVEPLNHDRRIQVKTISEYARALHVSQNHLTDTVKSITGKTAGQLIHDHLIQQATILLKQSSRSVSEIAWLLGYDDPSYFARYYKRQTGFTPSAIRSSPL